MKKKFFLLIIVLIISNCAVKRGGYHYKVKQGDTINLISQKSGAPADMIMKSNNISDSSKLRAGRLLYIPAYKSKEQSSDKSKTETRAASQSKPDKKKSKKKTAESVKTVQSKTVTPKTVKTAPKQKIKQSPIVKDFDFVWPVNGKIMTFFSTLTRGLTIEVEENSEVKSAGAGVVIYTDNLKGYGNSIIVKHNEKYMTVYTYLKEIAVKPEQRIGSGEVIGKAGVNENSPDFDKPVIHFEIRQSEGGNPVAVNPLNFLD